MTGTNSFATLRSRGAQPDSGDDAPTLAEIGDPSSSRGSSRQASPGSLAHEFAHLSPGETPGTPEASGTKRLGSPSLSAAGNKRPCPSPTATKLAERLARQAMPAVSGPAATAGTPPFSLPDSMKLHPGIRAHLTALQEELDANPARSLDEKAGGPDAQDLFHRLKDTAFGHFNKNQIGMISTALGYFDAYRKRSSPTLMLADAWADLLVFERHAHAAKEWKPQIDSVALHRWRDACFPASPARQKVRELLGTEPALAGMNKNPSARTRALTHGTDIDLHLARQRLHFADMCPHHGDEHAGENRVRARRFIAMKDAMIANAPINSPFKGLLRTLRRALHPLAQDRDLETLINSAAFENGDAVGAGAKDVWRMFAPELAEVLAEGEVAARDFVLGVRGFADVAGETPEKKLQRFQEARAPFLGAELNHAGIAAKLVTVSHFHAMVRHIMNNPRMENILSEP